MKLFLFHGAFGHPGENWFPWLQRKLVARGWDVAVPKFPTPVGQSLSAWWKVITPHLGDIKKDTILVGHSLGATFALRVLEKLAQPVRGAFLVAPVLGDLGNSEFDKINYSFYAKPFDWEAIRKNSGAVNIYHSSSDPYVPFSQAENVAEDLRTKVRDFPKAGHFNAEAGYDSFPELFTAIESLKG